MFTLVSIAVFIIGHKEYGYTQQLFTNVILKFLFGAVLLGINLLPILIENRKALVEYVLSKLKRE
jgi:hypothetical protein